MRSLRFFREFLRDPGRTGAVLPSGIGLCRLLASTAGVPTAQTIVEFGTGTGVVTEEIMRQKAEHARLIGIELNEDFAESTRRRCPGAEVVTGSAADAKAVLAARGLSACDCIVSGLPWAAFPVDLQQELLGAALEALRPGGRFVTFAYIHGLPLPAARQFKAQLQERFAVMGTTSVVWANMPPALVYWANKED